MPKDGKKERKSKSSGGKKEKKVKVSVLYEVTIKGIDKLARDDNGNKMYIQYKRGKKSSNHGKTKEAVIQYNFVQWDEKINIKSTLLQTPSTGKFDPKTIDFHVIQLAAPKFSKKNEVAVMTMNLADYAQPSASSPSAEPSAGPKAWNVIQSVQFPVQSDSRKGSDKNASMGLESIPQFEIMVKSRWLKYNGKLLIQTNKDKESGKPTVRVGDEEFDLQTDKEGSDDDDGDTTLGGGSDDESEVESEFEDDDFSENERKGSGIAGFKASTDSKSGKTSSRGSDASSSSSADKSDSKRIKALQEEVQKLKQQLRQVNETSQIRLENISAQRREIEDLREQVDGGKPASPKLGGASDSQVNDLIKTVGLYFKKDKDDSERTCHWLGFTATLTTLFTGMARSDEGVPSSLQSKLPDLQGVGIDLEKQAPSADVLRSVSPPARTAFILEMMLREIYIGLLNSFYHDLDDVLLPVIFEDQSIEKLEMLSKKKGSSSRQPFTWKLSAIATQMAANRLPMVIQLQFFTQVFYYVGSQLWNTLLERPELCTCNFGFHLKYAVSELRSWINTQNLHDENFHPSQQLNRILDAAGVLVVSKSFFDDAKIPQDLQQTFPALSLHEIKFLLEHFIPDKSAQEKGIPTSVKRKLDAAAQKEEGSSSSLELDPFASVPSPFSSSSSSSSSSSGKNKPKGRR